MPLADATDRGVAAHLTDRLDVVRKQQRLAAHPRRRQRGLGSGMATADHNDVELLRIAHGNKGAPASGAGARKRAIVGMTGHRRPEGSASPRQWVGEGPPEPAERRITPPSRHAAPDEWQVGGAAPANGDPLLRHDESDRRPWETRLSRPPGSGPAGVAHLTRKQHALPWGKPPRALVRPGSEDAVIEGPALTSRCGAASRIAWFSLLACRSGCLREACASRSLQASGLTSQLRIRDSSTSRCAAASSLGTCAWSSPVVGSVVDALAGTFATDFTNRPRN